MAPATATGLSQSQLRDLANDASATLASLTAVVASLTAADEESRQWACEALENCGTPEPQQIAALTPLLAHPDALVVYWTCKLMARMEQASRPAQPQLIEVLRAHGDLSAREEAARALGAQGELSSTALSALEQAATDGGPRLKRIANTVLGR